MFPIDLFILDPDKWLVAHDALKNILPSCLLSATVLDRYLFVTWSSLERGSHRARYMPIDFLHYDQPAPEEIARFRAISGLPPSGICSPEPVVGVVMQDECYYVVVVIPGLKAMHLIGRKMEELRDLDDWKLWEQRLQNIGIYHAWDMQGYVIYHADWPQDDPGNRGLSSCQIVELILADGFYTTSSDSLDPSRFTCAHSTFLKVMQTIRLSAKTNIARFSTLYEDHRPILQTHYGSRLEGIEKRIREFQDDAEFVDCLQQLSVEAMLTCDACITNDAADDTVYHSCIMDGEEPETDEDPDADIIPPELTRRTENSFNSPASMGRNDSNDLVNRLRNLAVLDGLGDRGGEHESGDMDGSSLSGRPLPANVSIYSLSNP